jgi:soluble lytic murein transglycosylase-like protein
MIRARHNPLVALGVWLLIAALAVLAGAAPPLRITPPTLPLALGALEGPTVPREWTDQLNQVADLAPPEYRSLVIQIAQRHGLDPRLLASVAWVETGGTWDPTLRGAAGEIGLMQVMPETAAWIAQVRGEQIPDLTDPAHALDYGAWYLARLLEGATADALAQYNAGPAWRERAPSVARQYSGRVLDLRSAPPIGLPSAPK